jgi:hypothetical protein
MSYSTWMEIMLHVCCITPKLNFFYIFSYFTLAGRRCGGLVFLLWRHWRHKNMLTEDKMETCEMSDLIKEEKGEEETPFYQAAFNSFDWNHSGRIATSVSESGREMFLTIHVHSVLRIQV